MLCSLVYLWRVAVIVKSSFRKSQSGFHSAWWSGASLYRSRNCKPRPFFDDPKFSRLLLIGRLFCQWIVGRYYLVADDALAPYVRHKPLAEQEYCLGCRSTAFWSVVLKILNNLHRFLHRLFESWIFEATVVNSLSLRKPSSHFQ